MKQIMNRFRNKFEMATIVLAFFAFMGCSDLADSKNDESKTARSDTKGCLVTGKVSVTSARSASSSLSLDGFSYSVSAIAGTLETLNVNKSVSGTFDTDSMTYSIFIDEPGDWTIFVKGRKGSGNNLLSGLVEVAVDDYLTLLTEKTEIALQPGYSTSESDAGAINLSITDETSTGKIKSLSYSATLYDLSTGNDNSLAEKTTVTFEIGTAQINLPSVRPNSYRVTFNFEDESGNTLYKCTESIVVFGGFTTDTWYGEGSHLVKNSDGTIEFKITDELIANYGAEPVPDTQMVLYTAYSNIGTDDIITSGYNFYLVDNSSGTLAETPSYTTSNTDTYGVNSFCFDKNGKIIYFFNKDGYPYVYYPDSNYSPKEFNSGNHTGRGITYDRKKDMYYVLGNEVNACFYELSSGIANASSTTYLPSVSDLTFNDSPLSLVDSPLAFAVHDGVVYIAYKTTEGTGLYLVCWKLSDASGTSLAASVATVVNLGGGNGLNTITDMIYQDGNVYLLARGSYFGTVIRYNTITGTVSSLPFPESFTMGALTGKARVYVEDHGTDVALYSDSECSKPLTVLYTKAFETIYAPDSTQLSSYLCGPSKFIAIKPKKLVIADDGIAFYTSSDDDLSFKNVNRVVYVDLESFSIVSTSETNASFDKDFDDMKSEQISNAGMDWSNYFSSVTELYNSDATVYGKDASGSVYTYSKGGDISSTYFSLVIPCSD